MMWGQMSTQHLVLPVLKGKLRSNNLPLLYSGSMYLTEQTLSRGIQRWACGLVSANEHISFPLCTVIGSGTADTSHRVNSETFVGIIGRQVLPSCRGHSVINLWLWSSKKPLCLSRRRLLTKIIKPTQKEPGDVTSVPSTSGIWGQANPWTFKFCEPVDTSPHH